MSDYISREAAIEAVREELGCETCNGSNVGIICAFCNVGESILMIKNIPAADVEPVVHGRWEKSEYRGFVRCSVCKDAYIDEDWLSSGKWGGCPNCRAKMDLAPPEGDSHG